MASAEIARVPNRRVRSKNGEVSVVTPWRYTRLVFALIIGAAVFGERPDAATLIGSAVIVGSGLYTLMRTRRTAAPSRG